MDGELSTCKDTMLKLWKHNPKISCIIEIFVKHWNNCGIENKKVGNLKIMWTGRRKWKPRRMHWWGCETQSYGSCIIEMSVKQLICGNENSSMHLEKNVKHDQWSKTLEGIHGEIVKHKCTDHAMWNDSPMVRFSNTCVVPMHCKTEPKISMHFIKSVDPLLEMK
jgi:hypothetical protein